jgi:signal transduction histidine kinase/DNA-binding NarL/FixJ family response regulator
MSTAVTAVPLRVVIIDDTADLRDLLRVALGRGGLSVVGEAGDGLAGIEAVLLDLSMPVMDGIEALPQIRAVAPSAKIIVLSGFEAAELTDRALDSGADAYIQKGVSLGRILDCIRDVTGDRQTAAPSIPFNQSREARPTSDGTATPASAQSHPPEDNATWGDALTRAPFGVLEVDADEPHRLIRMNVAAGDLLAYDSPEAGAPLRHICPELATAVSENRLRGEVDFETSTDAHLLKASLRPIGTSLLIYICPISDEVGALRSAIATTAHEIRGPVGVLCGVAETLALVGDGYLEPSLRERLMASAQRQAHVLDSITADLLTAAQIQRGTLRVDPRALDPVALSETLIQERYPGSVTLEVGDTRHVLADERQLEQMIGNLLCNADKYGQAPIVLRTRPCPGHPELMCIDVQDNGPGVSAEFETQLFREFSRASGTAVAGTGLGLHVVRSLAEAQGGRVSYATAPGGGAVFTLTLQAIGS